MKKTVLWDFDEVILDSMKVRDWGFEQIFKSFNQELIDKLLIFHKKKWWFISLCKNKILL